MWISRYVTLQDTSLVKKKKKKKKKKELNCGALGSNDMERAGAEAAGRLAEARVSGRLAQTSEKNIPVQARDTEESHTSSAGQAQSCPLSPG